MRKRTLLAGLAGLALTLPSWGEPVAGKFDPARNAQADVTAALARAEVEHKRVLVDVGGEWCVWCHIFDRFVAARPDVQRALDAHYIVVKVNYSPQNRNEQLLSRWPKAVGYPHFYVLDSKGIVVASQRSADLERGDDYDAEKVLSFLRRNAATA